MEKNKRMQFYGGTLGACAPLLVFMCLMIVIAAMKKVSPGVVLHGRFRRTVCGVPAGKKQKGI